MIVFQDHLSHFYFFDVFPLICVPDCWLTDYLYYYVPSSTSESLPDQLFVGLYIAWLSALLEPITRRKFPVSYPELLAIMWRVLFRPR